MAGWREHLADVAEKLSPFARDYERVRALREAGPHDPARDLRALAARTSAHYEREPGESAERAAERTGAAPDIASIPREHMRQAVQRLATRPEPVSWLADIDPETEREAGQ